MLMQREVEAGSWGRLLLANAWPAYVFGLLFLAKAQQLVPTLASGPSELADDSIRYAATVAERSANVLFAGLIVILYLTRRPTPNRHATRLGGGVAMVGTFCLTAVVLVPAPADAPSDRLILASVVTFLGTVFASWSLVALGRCLAIFPEVRGLVQRGPYRWIRHPVYLGEIVAGLGIVLAKPHPLVLLVFAAFVGLQYWRTLFEEAALGAAFPEAYPAYRARTGRLLPRWR